MYPRSRSVVNDDPPPAYMAYNQDCHSSNVHELPSDHDISELAAVSRPLELESPIDQTPDLARHASQVPVEHIYHEHHRATEHNALQGLSRTETSRPLWGSDTVQYPGSVSGSTIYQQLQRPLPISPPRTPDAYNDPGTQLGPSVELHRGALVYPDVYSPPQDHQDEFNMPMPSLNYAFQHGQASHANINHAELSLFFAQIPPVGYQQSRRDSHPHYNSSYPNAAEPYNARDNTLLAARSPVDNSCVPSHGMTRIPLGVYDFDESRGWQHHDGYGQETNNFNAVAYSARKVDASYTFAKLDDRQHYEDHGGSGLDAEEDDESLSCSQCSTLFHGKYVTLPDFIISMLALTKHLDTAAET